MRDTIPLGSGVLLYSHYGICFRILSELMEPLLRAAGAAHKLLREELPLGVRELTIDILSMLFNSKIHTFMACRKENLI